MRKITSLFITLSLVFSLNASAVRQRNLGQQRSYLPYGLIAAGVIGVIGAWKFYSSAAAPAKADLSQEREKGVTTAVFRYPNLILAVKQNQDLSRSHRKVLILGPGIASLPSNAVPQLHELAPFFVNDHITIVDNSRQVMTAVKESHLSDYDKSCIRSVISNDDNYSKLGTTKERAKAKSDLTKHVRSIPENLSKLSIDFKLADFTQYQLEADSVDVLIATKSLAYGFFKEKTIVDRYLSALKKGGVAYLAIEEFTAFIGGQPRGTRTHLDAFAYFESQGILDTVVEGRNGMHFQIRVFDTMTTNRDPTGATWAVQYNRPDIKDKKAFSATSPIFEITRLE